MPKTVFQTPALLVIFTAIVATFPADRLSAQEQDAEQDAIALLQQMGAAIENLDAFIVTGDGYADARLSAGQIIENASEITMRVQRPGTMRLTNRTAEGAKEIYFSNGVLSIYTEKENFYAQADIPEDMEAALDFVITELGLDAPLLDFCLATPSMTWWIVPMKSCSSGPAWFGASFTTKLQFARQKPMFKYGLPRKDRHYLAKCLSAQNGKGDLPGSWYS